jgi:hypothetical protein
MPYADKQLKSEHNKQYKAKNRELLTIQRIIRLKQKVISEKTYEEIKNFVKDESFWESVSVGKTLQQKTDEKAKKIVDIQSEIKPKKIEITTNDLGSTKDICGPIVTNTTDFPGYLYMIHEREFKNTGEHVYKVGRTIEIRGRMPQYPKDSDLVTCMKCNTNIKRVERMIITTFQQLFIHQQQYGAEYFKGDRRQMVKSFNEIVLNEIPLVQQKAKNKSKIE